METAFIEAIRAKLAQTTVEHYINGRFAPGARGEIFDSISA